LTGASWIGCWTWRRDRPGRPLRFRPRPAASGNYREGHHDGDFRGDYRGDYRKRDGKRRSFLSELFD